jgi:Glycosyltransferase family 87
LYPAEFFDRNHYGPIFSLIIAPFALLPDWLGMTLWSVFNTSVLVFAINQLPLKYNQINIILWLCAHEFLTTILSFQFNPIMTAIIILSYVFIIKKQDFWAAMVITLGLFVKLYGIVGLAFFFFSKNKLKFIISILFWSIIFFVLPMLITSPEYICQTYIQWLERLVSKNTENASLYSMQDISFMGMFRRIFNSPKWSNLPFLAFGLLLFGMQYLKLNFYTNLKFQLLLLSSVLIFTVIFSSGSESPTYIIAFLGVAIWFVIQEKPISNATFFLLIFAIILTSLSPSDLIPKFIRQDYIRPYALKAFPCVIIWFRIVYEIIFLKKPENRNVISV